jgi:hypothetical protein
MQSASAQVYGTDADFFAKTASYSLSLPCVRKQTDSRTASENNCVEYTVERGANIIRR